MPYKIGDPRRKESLKRYYEKHKTEILEKQRKNPKMIEWKRTSHLKRYGLTKDMVDNMIVEQNGRCAICGEIPQPKINGKPKKVVNELLYVDHNHHTHVTRGLLCRQCNAKLSALEHEDFLLKAMNYLKKYDDWILDKIEFDLD